MGAGNPDPDICRRTKARERGSDSPILADLQSNRATARQHAGSSRPRHWSASTSMARIYPFRALRYNPSRVRIEDVVTQPYDKITPSMQQAYYQRSPHNLVRIILGLPELFDGALAGDGKGPSD